MLMFFLCTWKGVWYIFFNVNFKVRYSKFGAGIANLAGTKFSRLKGYIFSFSPGIRHPDIQPYLLIFGVLGRFSYDCLGPNTFFRKCVDVWGMCMPAVFLWIERVSLAETTRETTEFITHDAQSVLPVVLAWNPPKSQQAPFCCWTPKIPTCKVKKGSYRVLPWTFPHSV